MSPVEALACLSFFSNLLGQHLWTGHESRHRMTTYLYRVVGHPASVVVPYREREKDINERCPNEAIKNLLIWCYRSFDAFSVAVKVPDLPVSTCSNTRGYFVVVKIKVNAGNLMNHNPHTRFFTWSRYGNSYSLDPQVKIGEI